MPKTAPSSATATPSAPHGILGWFQRRWVSTKSSPRDQEQQPAHVSTTAGPTHLIVLVNGLFGSSSNWEVMCEQLRQHLPPDTLLHPSTVNARFATYQGIDTCGQRLADEIRAVAASHPSLTRLSVVAHSMGGLMARYALGALFKPGQGRVAGLEPCHFVSMATPHCGCDADGVAQVPFIGWTGDIPLLGQQLYRFLSSISGSTASLIFQRTGQQFFLLDGAAAARAGAAAAASAGNSDRAAVAKAATAADADRDAAAVGDGSSSSSSSTAALPLLLQMTQDCPDRGLFFYSVLAAFKTRTAYANMDGDHLVGFANSSLRAFDQLPPPPPTASTAKGVVLQDRLSAAFWPHDWHGLGQQWSSSSSTQQQQQQQSGSALGAAVSRPYAGSRDWSHARQQQQQQRGFATAGAASTSQSEASGLWQVLSNQGSTVSSREGGDLQQQQQQQDAEHASGALAALELEAGGAGPAATAAVAAVGAAAAGSSGSSGGTAAVAATDPDDLHYSRFRAQPGRGGAPLKTAEESAAEAAAAAAAAAAELTDSTDEVLDLQYRNPLSPEPGQQQQQQQQSALSSIDFQPKPQQQQQQLGVTPAATAASGAAALAAAEADLTSGLSRQGSGPLPVAGSPAQAAADVAADASRLAAAVSSSGRAEVVSHMLHRLQELPWRRIDVSFQGARFGFAHNNIQVTRRWWNFEGVAVPAHLAQQLQLMDSLLLGPEGQQQ